MTTVSQAWIAEHLGMKTQPCKQGHPLHGFIAERENFSATLKCFVSEKMKENEPRPPVFETGSIDFKKT
jgi:hypothetical protein